MKKIFFRKNSLKKGSITVEASIVVPIVIFSIIAVILMGLILYQRAVLQSIADKAVREGAASWESLSADTATGKTNISGLDDNGLYWRLFEADSEEKRVRLERYTEALLARKNILKPESRSTSAVVRDYIIYKRLELSIEYSYRLPGGAVMRIFGSDGRLRLKVTSFAVIDDPAELIRNTDFILDIEKELENKYPGLKNMGDKTREVFNKMKDGLNKFIK